MKTKNFGLLLLMLLFVVALLAQTTGDFRTRQNGNWNNASTWQRFNGSSWVNAAYFPTYNDNVITVLAAHTVTVTTTVQIDQAIIFGTVAINSDAVDLDINDGTGTDLQVFGSIVNYGDVDKESSATIVYESGSKYQHARNGGTIETATWNVNAECQVTGITTTDPLSSSYNQAFGSFTWNCPSQTILATTSGNLTTINGNFQMKSTGSGSLKISTSAITTLTIGGKFVMSGGIFIVTDGSADNMIILQGDSLKISGGTLTENGSQIDDAIFRLNKTGTMYYEKTGGLISGSISFEVLSGCTLDLGTSILGDPLYSSGYFTLNSGAGLKTQHSQGISTSSSTGCVQMISSKTYSNSASYTFYRNGAQASGNGFQTTQNSLITIGSSACATTFSLTNGSVLVNNKLILMSNSMLNSSISGTVSYGASAMLEYQGASAQTTASGEFPSSGGPYHLTINNLNGVTLHASRAINGTLYLTSGTFLIGANTLTLNGAITKTSGSLAGGSSSNLTFGGSGASTNLPAIILNNLTINRANGIVLTGDVTTHGTISLTNGSLAIGANTLTINGSITKTSGSLTGGNTSTIVFGGSGAATGLVEITLHTLTLNRANGLNLLGNLTIKNQLNLTSGALNIGAKTIFMDGIINTTAGSLNGGNSSNIEIRENASPVNVPAVIVNNITLNRVVGANLTGDITVFGTIYLTSGNFSIGSNTLTLYGFISASGGSLTGGNSSNLVFEENPNSEYLQAITLNQLTINRSGGVNLSGDISLNGDFTIQNGTLKATGRIIETAGNVVINDGGILWIDGNSQLRLSGGKALNVNSGGIFKATGDPLMQALITQNNLMRGYYSFWVNQNGTIAAQNCIFEFADIDGVKINQGATVDESFSFTGCTFQNGEPGGQLLTIDNNQEIVIENAIFPENTWGSLYNAGKSTDFGSVYFYQSTGSFAGPDYENDAYECISWSGVTTYQNLEIPEGWSGISTRIIPVEPEIETMFQPIASELVILYNLTGFYWPGENINELGDWNTLSGYVIKATSDVLMTVDGTENPTNTVELSAGWNLIPVFNQVPASEILEALPRFVVAKGIATGEILWPEYNIATLEFLNVGKSYFVYTTQAGTITYPTGIFKQKNRIAFAERIATPWNEVKFTPATHLVAFDVNNLVFEAGDIVGGFTLDGKCAGIVKITDTSVTFALSLNGDDATSAEVDGFETGEIISYKLYRPGTGEVFDLQVSYKPDMNSGNFQSNGLSEITQVKMTATSIANLEASNPGIYPNPTHGIFNISGSNKTAGIRIMNAFGEEIFNNEMTLPAKLGLTGRPNGVYLIRIEYENNVFIEKLILN